MNPAEAAKTGASLVALTLAAALEHSPSAMILGETRGGIAGTLFGLAQRYPQRVLELPVAERGTLGLALGLALGGRAVVAEIAGTSRLRAALDVLAEAGAIARSGEFAVPLVVRVPYGTYAPGHDVAVGGWLLHLDGIQVVCPSTAGDLAAWLVAGMAGRAPLVILEPVALYAAAPSGITEPPRRSQLCRESSARPGRGVTLAAAGGTVELAMSAASELAADGIEADVLELVSLSPLDTDVLAASVRRTGRLVVVHPNDAAMARHIRVSALDGAFWSLEAPLTEVSAAGGTAPVRAVSEAVRSALAS